ncbi:hypothetical protein HDV05_001572, partial [Chytridiales sp. JEL 0842]
DSITGKESTQTESFDHVILTAPANLTLKMLGPCATEQDQKILGSFIYEKSMVVVHGDESLMPTRKEDWAPVNFINQPTASMTTLLSPNAEATGNLLFQTWNPLKMPPPELTHKTIPFYRPIVTRESVQAVREFSEIQGRGNVWFAGAYMEEAIPLQESGVSSAVRVCRMMGVDVPWFNKCNKELETVEGDLGGMYGLDLPFRSLFNPSKEFTTSPPSSTDSQPNTDTISMNWGVWTTTNPPPSTIHQASTLLVEKFGSYIGLRTDDHLLSVGVGCGDELLTLQNTFQLTPKIHALEPVKSQLSLARSKLAGCNAAILHGHAGDLPYASQAFTKLLAIDSAYHFNTRSRFLKEAFRVLKPGGVLGLFDFGFNVEYTHHPSSTFNLFEWLGCKTVQFVLEKGMRIPRSNQVGLERLKRQVAEAGFGEVMVEDWTKDVFPGFYNHVVGDLLNKVWREKKSVREFLVKWVPLFLTALMMKMLCQFKFIQFLVVRAVKLKSE